MSYCCFIFLCLFLWVPYKQSVTCQVAQVLSWFRYYYQCVKSLHIRSFSGLYFTAFELNTGNQSKYGKIRTTKTPTTDTFYSVYTKMMFSVQDFLSRCAQIRRKLWIYSQLLKISWTENFILYKVYSQKANKSDQS